MKKRLRSDLLPAVTLATLVVFTSACVRPDPPSVGMSKVEASLVFGFTEPETPQPTPIEQVATPFVQAAPVANDAEPLGFELPGDDMPVFEPLPTVTRQSCPTAPETAVAAVPAGPRVTADPMQGTSRWKMGGFVSTLQVDGTKARADLRQSYFDRAFRNFKRESATAYTFEMVDKEGRDRFFISTFRVNNNAVARNPSDGVGTVVTPGGGEPERGITLEKTETVDARTGQVLDSFVPTTGLLLLPLPVIPGESFTSVAVDPRSGQTIVHESVVRENKRFDACGEVVDAWLVESTRSMSGTQDLLPTRGEDEEEDPTEGLERYGYKLAFATQYGGVPVFEQLHVDDPAGCTSCPLSIELTIGDLTPEPLGS